MWAGTSHGTRPRAERSYATDFPRPHQGGGQGRQAAKLWGHSRWRAVRRRAVWKGVTSLGRTLAKPWQKRHRMLLAVADPPSMAATSNSINRINYSLLSRIRMVLIRMVLLIRMKTAVVQPPKHRCPQKQRKQCLRRHGVRPRQAQTGGRERLRPSRTRGPPAP